MLAECGGDHHKLMEQVDEHEKASGRKVIPAPPPAPLARNDPQPPPAARRRRRPGSSDVECPCPCCAIASSPMLGPKPKA
jgi:hypothetical protein